MFLGTCCLATLLQGCDPPIPEEWVVDLEPVMTLGEEPATSETAFYTPLDLGFDDANNLYVLDAGNARVHVFDRQGHYRSTLGRPGEGPGELSEPTALWVEPDGEVLVADAGNRRIQPFGASGAALDPITLAHVPLDVVATGNNLFVLRLPDASLIFGPDSGPLIQVLTRDGRVQRAFLQPRTATAGILFFLVNTLQLAADPGGGVAVAETHGISRVRRYFPAGDLAKEIPVLYKAGTWAPLDRMPRMVNEASVSRIARTATDLCWDPQRRLFWVLAGYSDRTSEAEWISGQEIYRYSADGKYRGSLMLPVQAIALVIAPDGKIWVIDGEGLVHGFRLRDRDMEPSPAL